MNSSAASVVALNSVTEQMLELVARFKTVEGKFDTVIATAKVMGYAGMTHAIAETAVAATGTMYPFIAAFIGSTVVGALRARGDDAHGR